MLNYYLKDVYEEKQKRDINEMAEQVEIKKQEAKDNKEQTEHLALQIEHALAEFKEKTEKTGLINIFDKLNMNYFNKEI